MTTIGYVKEAGKAGEKLGDNIIIYSSQNCLVQMRGPDTKSVDMDSDGTLTGHDVNLYEAEIAKENQSKLIKLQKMSEELENKSLIPINTASVSQWFDDMEQFIDSIPTLKTDGTIVYEVENKDGSWYYNGVSMERDPEWNQKVRKVQKEFCNQLNAKLQDAMDCLTTHLESFGNRLAACKPIMMAFQILSSPPSLSTIVKWATAVIDFLTGVYKMIYNTYKIAMETMQLFIVRFPQLISKAMSKVSTLGCPITVKPKPIKINVKTNTKK